MAILEEPIKEVEKLKNYINGEWVESKSDEILDIVNPATQKLIAKVPMSPPDEVNAAIEAAKEAFPDLNGEEQLPWPGQGVCLDSKN